MNRRLFVLFAIAFVLLFSFASAETIFERTFAEMGYESVVVSTPKTEKCSDFSVVFPQEQLSDEKAFAVVSINAEFLPVLSDDANISVSFNGSLLAAADSTSLYCPTSCFLRLDIDGRKILSENSLRVCVRSSDSTPKAVISNDSKIGVYYAPRFRGENFVKSTAKGSYVLGETAKVSVSLTNSGSESAFVELKRIRPVAKQAKDYKTFDVLDGESEWKGFINAGETKTISYSVKPTEALTMTLPPAIAYYKNGFGDEISVVSNAPTFSVREPEKKLSSIVVISDSRVSLDESAKLDVLVKNNGSDALYGLSFALDLPEGIEVVSGDRESVISFLAPGESKKFSFKLSSQKTGSFAVGCTLGFSDSNSSESCEPNSVEFTDSGLSPAIVIGIVLLLAGAGVYFYLKREG